MMNKILTTAVLFLFVQSSIAQKGIDNLIRAEKDFAAWSVAHSTKEAFLKYIDSNSIMFDNGKPVKAIDLWNKREKNAAVLNWWPEYAEISASGDFGYTTGPWTFQATKNDSFPARGQYITVWHINNNGEWKFLVDFGIDNTQVNDVELKIFDTPKEPENLKAITHVAQLVVAETNFLKLFAKNKLKAYRKYGSKENVMNRNHYLPALPSHYQYKMILETPLFDKYTMEGWGVSSVPDMGYTYGTTITNGKTDNYLRIWRREKTGWKIAVEVLRY